VIKEVLANQINYSRYLLSFFLLLLLLLILFITSYKYDISLNSIKQFLDVSFII